MAGSPGTFRFPEVNATPPAPPAGYALIYIKTNNVLYLQDSSGTEIALGSASAITQLTGDVTASGPGVSTATVVSVGGASASDIAAAVTAYLAATASNTASTIVKRDASGNFAANIITAALSGNATTATTATNFSGSLVGDVTGTQGATVVASVGGSSAANIHNAELAANAATAANTASTIVKRDASGNFAANVITASLTGNVTGNVSGSSASFTGNLVGDVTGTQGATVVATVGGSSAANVHSAELLANASTASNTASTIVKRDASGNFAANIITAALSGNATTATTSINFSGSLVGDVSGTQGATSVDTVGGSSAANIHSAELLANAATNANTASTIVKRNASGNFSAGTITANLSGNATTATTAVSFSGALVGDVTGTQGATVVSTVGGSTAANVHSAELLANAATDANTASTIVKRDASGNFTAGTITAALTGLVNGVDTAAHAARHQPGGADAIATAAPIANLNYASTNTEGTATSLARSDHSHALDVGTPVQIGTSNNAGASNAGVRADHVHAHGNQTVGTLHAAVTTTVNGFMSAADKVKLDAATNANTASTLVMRDASGNFAAGTITANLSGNATSATTAGSATNFTGSLVGDVTGTQGATVVSTVGTSSAANVHSAELLANAATDANTASTIVKRDASGNFIAGAITAKSVEVNGTGGAGFLQLDTQSSTPATPAAGNVKVYTNTSNGFNRVREIDSNGSTFALDRDLYEVVYNTTGSSIPKGTLVYINGVYTGGAPNVPTIALARSDSPTTAPAFGITYDTIANNSFGRILTAGNITGIDTSAFANGNAVYLSSTVAGAMTATEPLAPNISQLIGYVTNAAVSGNIDLSIRAGLNTASGSYRSSFKVGPGSGSAEVDVVFANAFLATLGWNPTATFKLLLPPTQGGAGSYLSNTDGAGTLGWTNPLVNIDGGSAASNYTASQVIDGGTP